MRNNQCEEDTVWDRWCREPDPNLWGAYRLEIIRVSLEMSSLLSTLAYQLYTVCVYTFIGYDEHELMMLELARRQPHSLCSCPRKT